jgi:hypothetical protein
MTKPALCLEPPQAFHGHNRCAAQIPFAHMQLIHECPRKEQSTTGRPEQRMRT